MAKKKVCVSFDYEHDKKYYYMLKAWDLNPNFDFSFNDCTPSEIQSDSVSVVKQVLSKKINEANYMIAIIGENSTDKHVDSNEIGYNNWQAYEIDKNHDVGNGLVVVKINGNCSAPNEAYGIGAVWVNNFTQDEVVSALNQLSVK